MKTDNIETIWDIFGDIPMKLVKMFYSMIEGILREMKLWLNIIFGKGHILTSVFNESRLREKKVPWFTYPAIEFLDKINFKKAKVLEWGSGNGTIYWSKNAKAVVSVESDLDWHAKVKNMLKKDNVDLRWENFSKYYKNLGGKYDIIVIDGIMRILCMHQLQSYKKPNTIIILDNSERYDLECEMIAKKYNMLRIDFTGFGPINAYEWTTTIFLPRGIKLEYK